LISEAPKTASAAAIAVFHRPESEDALETGRAFYRLWLEIARLFLIACPISVLADLPGTNTHLSRVHNVPRPRHLVNVFRIGRPRGTARHTHFRLPVDELIVA